MDATFLVSGINIALLLALLYPAVQNVRRIRSPLAAGLLLFVLIFLVEGLTTLYFNLDMMPFYTQSVEPLVLAIGLLKTFSFATLTWITYR
jgi:hypothetical protein